MQRLLPVLWLLGSDGQLDVLLNAVRCEQYALVVAQNPEVDVVGLSWHLLAVAGHEHTNVFSYSAAFTWDGEVIILGWEPGAGVPGKCGRRP